MLQAVIPLLLDMARAAREISVPKFRTGLIRELKRDSTPVSAIDRAVEKRLHEFLPHAEKLLGSSAGFLGEEYDSVNTDADYVFVVDPIDGTKKYLLGSGEWFTLIGLHKKGEGFVAGLCDQPDADRTHYAVRGGGAFVIDRKNLDAMGAVRLPMLAPLPLAESIIMSFDHTAMVPAHAALFAAMQQRCLYTSLGGDAGNYMRIAEGTGQVVMEAVGGIYDIAAIAPILAEVGGCITGINPDGTPFVPDLNFGTRRTVLATASEQLRDDVLALL